MLGEYFADVKVAAKAVLDEIEENDSDDQNYN